MLPGLASVNAGDCGGISGAGFAAWGPLAPSLATLQLPHSGGLGDAGLAALAAAIGGPKGRLQELNLKHCKAVTDEGLRSVAAALGKLTCLSLQVWAEWGEGRGLIGGGTACFPPGMWPGGRDVWPACPGRAGHGGLPLPRPPGWLG